MESLPSEQSQHSNQRSQGKLYLSCIYFRICIVSFSITCTELYCLVKCFKRILLTQYKTK